MFPAMFVIGSTHQDERLQKTMPKEFYQQTSLWPFQAIYEGRNDLKKAWEEMNKKAIIVALVSPLFFI
jgi:uncharacterized membrane protein